MDSILIYSSTDGQTRKICEAIKNYSKNKNNFKIVAIENYKKIILDDYKQIIIGASIRYGKYNSNIYKLIKENKKILESKKNAFFSVNVVARKPNKNTPETNPYIKKFLNKTKWMPMKLGVFAGKVDYPSYNIINKLVIKFIMMITKGPTDTSKSYEFTNWEEVKKFTKDFDNLNIV